MQAWRLSKWTLVFVAFVACGIGHAAMGQDTVPLKDAVVGYVTLTPLSLPDLRFKVDYHAHGVVQDVGEVTADFSTPEAKLQLTQRKIEAVTPSWNVTLKTAAGDEISGEYAFDNAVIPFSRLGFFEISAQVVVTGGTGQFAGATGSATTRGFGNVFLGVFVLFIDGSVTTG